MIRKTWEITGKYGKNGMFAYEDCGAGKEGGWE